ncbi:MAG: MerR family transcriptional regulator [Bacteroidetes bacterium]|nr:MAG: MerR family transcriptional regulator [Bacteroidota bacterium]
MLENKKVYYKIGEVADMFQVSTSLIRYWEQEFKMIKPRKTKNGIRQYTLKDIDNFQLIHHLIKEKGMTMPGAHKYIKNKKQEDDFDKLEVINTLKRTKTFLQDIKDLIEKKESGEK